jgi:glutamate racemase
MIKTQNRPHIGVFDSGVGGLYILSYLTQYFPSYDFSYFGDVAFMPYGSRSVDQVVQRSHLAINWLRQECQVDYVLVACNTACAALYENDSRFFERHPYLIDLISPTRQAMMDFVHAQHQVRLGVRSGARLVTLCTPLTYQSGLYAMPHNQMMVADGLAFAIEQQDFDRACQIFYDLIRPLILGNDLRIILACTHYVGLLPFIPHFHPYIINQASLLQPYLENQSLIVNDSVQNLSFYTSPPPSKMALTAEKLLSFGFLSKKDAIIVEL